MEFVTASVLVQIAGQVQGVGFRAWTARRAADLGLVGWVRNEPDGTVRALFTGRDEAVREMLGLLRKGPPGAEVAGVTTEPADPADAPVGFNITG